MSIPHTGKLEAVVDGIACHFDGDRWTSENAQLAKDLNLALEMCPTQHIDITSLAHNVMRTAGLEGRYQITGTQENSWIDELPNDAED